jgi:hypothetical protein
MLKNHEPDRNLGDLTDTEIYAAIRYLETELPYGEESDGARLATAVGLFVLVLSALGFVWFWP